MEKEPYNNDPDKEEDFTMNPEERKVKLNIIFNKI
jgi:hypothetical protein